MLPDDLPPVRCQDDEEVARDILPYIFGTVGSAEKNLIPDSMLDKNDIKFMVNEVTEIDRETHTISMIDGQMMRHCLMLTYDEEFCVKAEEVLKSLGIEILESEKVEAFLGEEKVEKVRLSSGREIAADMVILGIGAAANVKLAQEVGLIRFGGAH